MWGGANRGEFGGLADMWMLNPSTLEWTWMGGINQTTGCSTDTSYDVTICTGWPGIYGTLGKPSEVSVPGRRYGALAWSDDEGNFWLFGGQGYDNYHDDQNGVLNDLWRFEPSATTLPAAVTPTFSEPAGTYGAGGPLTISNGMAGATFYFTTDGTTPTTHATLYQGAFNVLTSKTVKAIATVSGYRNSGVGLATYIISPVPEPDFDFSTGATTPPLQVFISDQLAGVAIYYTLDGSTPTDKSAKFTEPISITTTTTLKAIAEFTGYPNSQVNTAQFILPELDSIQFTQPKSPVTYSGKPITLALAAKALSGLPVTFSILSGPATVRNSTVIIYGPGTVVVAADELGNLEMNGAQEVTKTIIVNRAK
jgi:Fn3 associated/Chitobiase/beta-hexosaminidase C-terminal domain